MRGARGGKFLPADEDFQLEVVLIRGHLLIEEELKELLQKPSVKPKVSSKTLKRTGFSAKVRLAQALYGDALPDWEWGAILEVGALRNSIAHRLEDEMFEPRIRRLLQDLKAKDSRFAYVESDDLTEGMKYCVSQLQASLLRLRIK